MCVGQCSDLRKRSCVAWSAIDASPCGQPLACLRRRVFIELFVMRHQVASAFALCILMRAISLTVVASSSIAASQNDANCEKSFTRGVEIYELGLQVGLHFAPGVSSFCALRQVFPIDEMLMRLCQSNNPQHFEDAVKVRFDACAVARGL